MQRVFSGHVLNLNFKSLGLSLGTFDISCTLVVSFFDVLGWMINNLFAIVIANASTQNISYL